MQSPPHVEVLLEGFGISTSAGRIAMCQVTLIEGPGLNGEPVRILVDPAHVGRRPLLVEALAAGLAERAAGLPFRLAIEPGRALVARAGSSLYRVMAVKNQGRRRFVVVDGGLADNPRPLLYGARHHPEVLAAAKLGPDEPATLAGRSCENDEMGDYVLPRDLAAGDLVALRTTGAYTYSMAGNYNRFGRPPVVFVRDGHHRRAVRGESADEVVRLDVV